MPRPRHEIDQSLPPEITPSAERPEGARLRKVLVNLAGSSGPGSRMPSGRADARLLGTTSDTPCLRVESVTRDATGRVLEAGCFLYRGDRYEVHTRARRSHP